MNKKLPFHIVSLLLIYLLLLVPMVVGHTATIGNVIFLLVTVLGTYSIGAAILAPVLITDLVLPITHAAVSVFIGSFVYSMLLFVTTSPVTIIAMLLVIISLIYFSSIKYIDIQLRMQLPDLVLFGMAILFIGMSLEDVAKQFSPFQVGTDCYPTDTYFFNAVVASIRKGSIYSAVYELNAPINYQLFGFFIPALWADILGISSHQAMWGLALPFYKLLIIALGYEVMYYYLKDKVSRTNYGFIVLSAVLPILLAPLHPLYVMKGDVKKFIFYGLGYLVPAGTIPFPVAIVLLLLCMFLFAKADWKNRKFAADKLLFILTLALMIIAKFPMYVSFVFFIGGIILKRVLIDKEQVGNYLLWMVASVVVAFIVYKVCMDQASGGHNYFRYGFLAELFGGWYHRKPVGVANNLIILGLIAGTYLLWMGLRLVGMLGLGTSGSPALAEYVTASIVSLVGATVMASFLRIETLNTAGAVISDNTFNSLGFIRSSFYMVSIVSTIGILYLLYSGRLKPMATKAVFAVTVIWCGLSLMSMTKTLWPDVDCPHVGWYDENYRQLKTGRFNDGLIVINPAKSYYGIMLSSSDQGRYWSCVDKYGTSYNSTTRNEYRWILFRHLLDSPAVGDLVKMKSEGVKYVISTPADSARLTRASQLLPNHLLRVPGTGWIYEIR